MPPQPTISKADIIAEIDARIGAVTDVVTDVLAEELGPVTKRLVTIERALDVTRKDVADTIQKATTAYLGGGTVDDDDVAPTLDELETMAARHKKTLENRK